MDILLRQMTFAERRYNAHTNSRKERKRYLDSQVDWRRVDDPERIFNRLNSRGLTSVISEAMVDVTTTESGKAD